MKIQHLSISNILGVQHLELDAGQFNAITGKNGQGKTSVLEAIKAALGGGHDATLLRKGADQGEVILVLDDETTIRRRVKESGSDTEVRQGGKKITKPGEFLKRIADLTSVNPVDFLRASKKDRARVLLEAMPLKVDTDKLTKLAGRPIKLPEGTHALEVIKAYHTVVYDDRTGTNRAAKEKEATINQLREAMPDAPGGVEGDEDSLRAQLQQHQESYRTEETRITNKLADLRAERDKDVAELEAQIAELRVKIEQRRAAFTTIEGKAEGQRAINKQRTSEAIAPINAALDAIVADRSAAAKRQSTLETIETMGEQLEALKKDAEAQTRALAAIEDYRMSLLNSLPIPGLEVRDGDIYRDGVQFDRLNTAQQVSIAVEIAKLRTGDLGLMCLDGLECLDSDSFEALQDAALESGLQLFVTRVTDDDGVNVESE